MGTEYYSLLTNEDKVRYDGKLMLANGIKLEDPYSMTEGWSNDITKLPNVAWTDLTNFLIETPSIYTKEAVEGFKSLEGCKFLGKAMYRIVFITTQLQNCSVFLVNMFTSLRRDGRLRWQ